MNSLGKRIIKDLRKKEVDTDKNIKINGIKNTIRGMSLCEDILQEVIIVDGNKVYSIHSEKGLKETKNFGKSYSKDYFNPNAEVIGEYNGN